MQLMRTIVCIHVVLTAWTTVPTTAYTTQYPLAIRNFQSIISTGKQPRIPTKYNRPISTRSTSSFPSSSRTTTTLQISPNEEEKELQKTQDETRTKVWTSRRSQIRSTFQSAEKLRYFRIQSGFVPGENGSDNKIAFSITAFVVAAGAVALRVGGRAALISGMGLDFLTENAELKGQLEQFLTYSNDLGSLKALAFIAAWSFVKVFCFDAGGVVLALSAGILFGGVIQGALFSALAATIGSSLAFGLSKLDTPVRKKSLELLDEYPSLRGIDKVVAKDGIKAVLTLRLAPILPIPIGAYNYVYGVSNVPYLDFAAGIFLGSLKPYLLDSYLGYFGKNVVEGNTSGSTEETLLLVALGVSVLIGVFASQLAGETWEAVQKEVEDEKRLKRQEAGEDEEIDDGIVRKVMGIELFPWIVGFQLSLQAAEERLKVVVVQEYDAKVWNYTKAEGGVPRQLDPALKADAPEIVQMGTGFDFLEAICEGFVFSPLLSKTYLAFADPLFNATMGLFPDDDVIDVEQVLTNSQPLSSPSVGYLDTLSTSNAEEGGSVLFSTKEEAVFQAISNNNSNEIDDEVLFAALRALRSTTEERIKELDKKSLE